MEYINLDVWIEARKLTSLVYSSTKNYPKEEIFGLTNQIRRFAVSFLPILQKVVEEILQKKPLTFCLLQGVLFMNLKRNFIYQPTKNI